MSDEPENHPVDLFAAAESTVNGDPQVLAWFSDHHWRSLARWAAEEGSDTVGLMSGGPRSVELRIEELTALGVHGWTEPSPRVSNDDPPRFTVFIRVVDLAKLVGTSAVLTPAQAAAALHDTAEYTASFRAARPWVEMWLGDVTSEVFEAELRARMTVRHAQQLRRWGIDEAPTWRGFAHIAHDELSADWKLGWTPPGHQGVGLMVVRVAASKLGEDVRSAPWA